MSREINTSTQRKLEEIKNKIKGYPHNSCYGTSRQHELLFSSLKKYFGNAHSLECDPLGSSEKYGSYLAIPSKDNPNLLSLVFCYKSPPIENEPNLVLFAKTKSKVYRHKDIINYSQDHFAELKLYGLILSAKKFMEGTFDSTEFIEISDDNPTLFLN